MLLRIAAACAFLSIETVAVAQEQDFSQVEIKVVPVSASVYMLQGAGGNIGASVGEDGVVLVDDEYSPLYDKITAALRGIRTTSKPVRFVFLTHYHGDHTSGNLAFANAGATIISQDNLRATLLSDGFAGNGGSMHMPRKAAEPAALPQLSFDNELTVHMNGEDIRAVHAPAAHTSGDSIVYFPKAHVVHMGDIFVRYGFPFIDVDTGGTVQGMIGACEAALAQLPADARIIPGHGEVASVDDLREYVQLLKDTSALVVKGIRAGQSLDDMKKAKLLAPWSERYTGKFVNADAFLESLYYSLVRKPPVVPVKH